MGGFANVVRGALAGLNEAAGNDQTAQALRARQQQAQDAKQQQLRMQVFPHAIAIKGLQERLQSLKSDDPHYDDLKHSLTQDIARNVSEVNRILNPDKTPSDNFFERGITDKISIFSLKNREAREAARREKRDSQAEPAAEAIAQGSVPFNQDPKFLQDVELEKLREKASAPKYENVQLQDGSIVPIDLAHYPLPPGAKQIVGKTSQSGVPRVIGHTSTQDALKLLQSGAMQYTLANGQNLTAEQLQAMPPYMELTQVRQGDKDIYYPTDQRTHISTVGNVRYQVPDVGGVMGNANPLGEARTPTTATDAFGVTTTTTPASPGIGGQAAPQPAAPTATPAQPKPAITKGHARLQQTRQAQTGGSKQLDATGHIPPSAGNPHLVEAANNILDGMDVDKLDVPQKDRTAAQELARQYGWKGQGLFTPREVLQLKEGANVIQQMLSSKALNVLDQGMISQLPMLGQGADPSKEGFFGRLGTKLASSAASPEQQEFMRQWRQLDALAVGLRGLVQTGRATQAQVDRIIAELPNPYNTTSSADAKERLKRVQNELQIAAQTGKLPDVDTGASTGAPTKGDDAVDHFLRNLPGGNSNP